MTINEIISQFIILMDCTTANLFALYLASAGVLFVVFFIWVFIAGIHSNHIGRKIVSIFFILCGLSGIAVGTFYYIKRPVLIDYYISVNNVEIEQVSKYFDIDGLSQINDMMVCHIVPKDDYYEDVLNFRNLNKEE